MTSHAADAKRNKDGLVQNDLEHYYRTEGEVIMSKKGRVQLVSPCPRGKYRFFLLLPAGSALKKWLVAGGKPIFGKLFF